MPKFSHLENIEDSAKAAPQSFFIPSLTERKSQIVGALVRLHFHIKNPSEEEPKAERMWVTVTKKLSILGVYKGELQNQPAYIEDLSAGSQVVFKPNNIAQVFVTKDDPNWSEVSELKAFASEACFEEGNCVRFVYRETPDNEDDSGWRMFSGTESQEYTDDPNNIRLPVVGWLLDYDNTLKSLIDEPVGTVYERDSVASEWRRVTDWSPES